MIFSAAISWNKPMNIAGMIAKYFETASLALNVVQARRARHQLLADLHDLDELGRVGIEVDHVPRQPGRHRSRVHRHAHIGVRQGRRVVGAIADHGDEPAAALLQTDQRELLFGRRLGEEVVDPGLGGGGGQGCPR